MRERPAPDRIVAVPVLAAILVAAAAATPAARASDLIYLNSCRPSGCTIHAGNESSINNTSSLISGTRLIGAFDPPGDDDDALWADFVACMERVYAPFDVVLTDVDPGAVMHREVLVAGTPQQAGFSAGVGGVAPFNCGEINNSITFAFANSYGEDIHGTCWAAAMEVAHTYGLDHEYWAPDVMTYLTGCEPKQFTPKDAACGEGSPRACTCGGDTQNSYEMLQTLIGPAEVVFIDPFEDDWECNFEVVDGEGEGLVLEGLDPGRPVCATELVPGAGLP